MPVLLKEHLLVPHGGWVWGYGRRRLAMHEVLGSISSTTKTNVAVSISQHTWELEARGSEIQQYSQPYSEIWASLGWPRLFLKLCK